MLADIGGNLMASHLGHSIKSPCESLTDRLLAFCGQGLSGSPSQRGMADTQISTDKLTSAEGQLERLLQQTRSAQ
jgi:hypothetical protein